MATKKFEAPARITKKSTKTVEGAAFVDVVNNVPKTVTMTDRAKGAPKAEKAARGPRGSYAGKKIKVLNKEHGAREGSKRATGMDIIIKSKTTDEAIPKLAEAGCDNSFIAFAVSQGFVELV